MSTGSQDNRRQGVGQGTQTVSREGLEAYITDVTEDVRPIKLY